MRELVLVVTCDVCGRPSSERGSEQMSFVWGELDRELDVCAECSDGRVRETTLGDLLAVSRPTMAKRKKKAAAPVVDGQTTPSAGEAKVIEEPVKFECPRCGHLATEGGMKHHVESRHDMTIAELAFQEGATLKGFPIVYVCSEGHERPFGFSKPQAIAQHRLQRHGDEPGLDVDAFRTENVPTAAASQE